MGGERSADLHAIGLTVLDILGRPVDAVPEGGGVEIIQEIRWTPAGTAAAPAMVGALLGLRTRLCGCVGLDEMGDVLLRGLEARGVGLELIQRTDALRTSATLLPIRSNGDRPALHAPGAGLLVEPPAEGFDSWLDARFIHLGGVAALPKLDGDPTKALLAEARSRGIVVTSDLVAPGPGALLALEAALPGIDYWMPTADEAMALSQTSSAEDAARWAMDLGAGACVFKDGGEGSTLFTSEGAQRFPAHVVEVVDTTGCGDAYCAGFVAALAHDVEVAEACRFATAVAGLVAGRLGSDGRVGGYEQALSFMHETPLKS